VSATCQQHQRPLLPYLVEAVTAYWTAQPAPKLLLSATPWTDTEIIDDGLARTLKGRRPLAGLTVAEFIAELHSPQSGAIGRVRGVNEASLKELRAAIPAKARSPRAPLTFAPAGGRPAADTRHPRRAAPAAVTIVAASHRPPAEQARAPEPEPARVEATAVAAPAHAPQPEAPQPEAPLAEPPAAPRRRGRPPGSKRAAQRGVAEPPAARVAEAEPKASGDEAALDELMRRWPALHPQARRAIVLYASTLLVEAAYEG
jgi:hypothetical protein